MKTYRKRYRTYIRQYRRLFIVLCISTILLLTLCIHNRVLHSLHPDSYASTTPIDTLYQNGSRYVHCSADTLYYTGYDCLKHSTVTGYYYYSLNDETCTIYLLSKETVGDTPPLTLGNVQILGKLLKNDKNLTPLLQYMANDMNWNYYGISHFSSSIIISECDYNLALLIALAAITLFVLLCDIEFFLYITWLKKRKV